MNVNGAVIDKYDSVDNCTFYVVRGGQQGTVVRATCRADRDRWLQATLAANAAASEAEARDYQWKHSAVLTA